MTLAWNTKQNSQSNLFAQSIFQKRKIHYKTFHVMHYSVRGMDIALRLSANQFDTLTCVFLPSTR